MVKNNLKIDPNEIIIEMIKESHDINSFVSYEKELVNFLQEDALNNQKQNLSITFLWFNNQMLASYITLLTDRITLEGDLKNVFQDKGIHYKSLPALKMGRLCVDDHFLRRGLGKLMVLFAIDISKEINREKAGCRFLTVDTKNNSVGFYQKLGFKILETRDNGTTAMYLDVLNPFLH